jgi:putative DNA primase/helicase
LLARIKSARSRKNSGKDDVSVEELHKDLIALEQAKPDEVVIPRLFYEDVNNPALASELAVDWPSASLWSDEGGLIIGGHGMSDDMAMGLIGLLNRLWDGNPFDRDRKTTGRVRIRGRRFAVSLMLQPIVMQCLLTLADGASRGMGLVARFLVTWPASTIGTRMYQRGGDMPAIVRLSKRLQELLDMPLPLDPGNPAAMLLTPPVLRFTAWAQRIWEGFHNDVEAELGGKGEYADVADIGAKIAENAARLAGVFHVVEFGPAGEISAKTLYRAIRVVSWHLYEARRVLTAFDKPESVSDAELVFEWLLRRPVKGSPVLVDPRHILQFGPSAVRDVKRRDAVIETFLAHNILLPAPRAALGRGAKRYILNPRCLVGAVA